LKQKNMKRSTMKIIAGADETWSGGVTDKEDPTDKMPEGLFKKAAGTIVTCLIRMADGDVGMHQQSIFTASQRQDIAGLNFFSAAGPNNSEKERL
jgi:hypothetical protein